VVSASSIASVAESNVVSFLHQKASEASGDIDASLSLLMDRASNTARQMRYFGLLAKRASYDELVPSAKRAGFFVLSEDVQNQEVWFQWASGKPDFVFLVSVKDTEAPSVVALSLGDIFGLVLTSTSRAIGISVELRPSIGPMDLGSNASLFLDILLAHPDFDDMPAWTKFL
jgi:hypothetical protein